MAHASHGQRVREVDEEDKGHQEGEQAHHDGIVDEGVGYLVDGCQHHAAHDQEEDHAEGEENLLDDRRRGS